MQKRQDDAEHLRCSNSWVTEALKEEQKDWPAEHQDQELVWNANRWANPQKELRAARENRVMEHFCPALLWNGNRWLQPH